MVSRGMRRYRQRTEAQASYIGDNDDSDASLGVLDPTEIFGRQPQDLRLEVGFGHGSFLSACAEVHPDSDFIGIEQNALRVTKTAHKSHLNQLDNVRLFHGDAHLFVRNRLPAACLHRAYILFSDPWPKQRHRRRRLVNRAFLIDLAHAMAPGGRLIFASDTHNYSLGVLSHLSTLPGLFRNRYQPQGYRFNIPTRFPTVFETYKKAAGCTIAYLDVERTDTAAPERVDPMLVVKE